VRETAAATGRLASDHEREEFLLVADVVARHRAPGGVTKSTRATLRRGTVVHDAHIQTVDIHLPEARLDSDTERDFRDTYKHNVAAYRIDRLLGLGMVPVTVERASDGTPAAFTWWMDDVLMLEMDRQLQRVDPPDVELWDRQMYVLRLFDQLIDNFDRNLQNVVIDKQWRIWMIDHTRAFRILTELQDEQNLGERCDRPLLAALRGLEAETLRARLGELLTDAQIAGLLARRDRIVRHFDALIARKGEAAILYDLAPR
jgi:hypothetical protein